MSSRPGGPGRCYGSGMPLKLHNDDAPVDQRPDVSCVIPTFNDRVNLARAVSSSLRQADVHVEVTLVDDCSDAETRAFIADLAATDPRIRTFYLPENGGQGRARNLGAALARGRYLAFMDQDDEHAPNWYRFAVGILDSSATLGALSGRACVIDIPSRFGIDETDVRIRGLSAVFTTNMLFRRSVFLASGGFPTSPLWRRKIAGEDGVYRQGFCRNWRAGQCDHPALVHRAKEGGATVHFLDRTSVEDNRVVMNEFDLVETDGTLEAARQEFYGRAAEAACEVRNAVMPAEADGGGA